MESGQTFTFISGGTGGGGSTIPIPVPVSYGGTGSTTTTNARTSIGAAASGANTDITSIALTSGTIATSPSLAQDIVNKDYVDTLASGLNWHQSCKFATTIDFASLSMAYANGVDGVGATLTKTSPFATLSIDGNTPLATNRILVKNAPNSAWNGIYVVNSIGSSLSAWQMTRATDYDTTGSGVNEIDEGDYILVTQGSANANTSWVQQTPLPITIGTTSIVFIQFAAIPTYPISIANGGTGASDTTNARLNLGLGSDATGSNLSSLTNTTTAQANIGLVIGTNVLAPNGSAANLTSFPTLNQNTTGTASNVTGVVAITNGGTGATSSSVARTNLGLVIGTDVLAPNGSASLLTNFPTLNQNTTGTASNITGILEVANGGTGSGDAENARINLGLVIGTDVLAPDGDASLLTNFPTLNQNTTGTASNVTGVVAIVNGGTGATTSGDARTNLGLVIGTDVLAPNGSAANLTSFPTLNQNTTGTASNVTGVVALANGGTGASTDSGARTNLGLGTIATQNANNVAITGGSVSGITDLAVVDGGTGASTASGARTNLGLGTIATQDSSNVSISGGSISGITDLAVLDGGTGASTASGARTNLGLVIGTDVLAPNGSAANLTSFPTLNQNTTGTASNVTGIVAVVNGGTGASDSTTARTNLGLGSMATQSSSSVSISGGTISGITDLAVADGGTGASDAATARTNLGLVIGTDVLAPNGSAANLTSFPTLNQNTTGTSSNVTGTIAVGNGGTGITTTPSNGALLIGNGTNYTSATLTAGAGIGVTNASGSITIANNGTLATAGGLTAVTPIAATTTYTTGAITLASQTMASGSVWRVRSFGTYAAVSNATARNAQISCFWGSTQLVALTLAVQVSSARTSNFELEFVLTGSSTTAVWSTGTIITTIIAATVARTNITPASTTVTAGAQTLDLRFSMSNTTAADAWSIQSVTMERLK